MAAQPTELGRRIAAARAYGGITSQTKLAELVGTSQSTLQRIETGGRGLKAFERLGLLHAIADACGVPYEWFTADLVRLAEISPSELELQADGQLADTRGQRPPGDLGTGRSGRAA